MLEEQKSLPPLHAEAIEFVEFQGPIYTQSWNGFGEQEL
jgi:hypothetical protein